MNLQASNDITRIGGLEINLARGGVSRDGLVIALSAREYRLLVYLVSRPDVVIPYEELKRDVWQQTADSGSTSNGFIKNAVYRLRNKVELNPAYPDLILTIRGRGIMLSTQTNVDMRDKAGTKLRPTSPD